MGRRIGILGLVNYRKHPSNENYHIFSFNSEPEQKMMEELLKERNIWFESSSEEIKAGIIYLVGVEKGDYDSAMQVNYLVSAKYRNPMIKNKLLRYMLIILTISMVTLGLIGYVKNMQKLNEKTEQIEQE